jgi:hypothetical protein
MPKGSAVKEGVRIIQGTPALPLERATLFLRMWKVEAPGKPARTLASLSMARPSAAGYVIKDLIPEIDTPPQAALDKAVAIAKRGDVGEIYLNADLSELPRLPLAVGER